MKKKLQLAPINAAAINLPATTPPPRKEDIIVAMVERARVKHAEEAVKMTKEKEAARQAFDKAVLEHFEKFPKAFSPRVKTWGNSAEIEHTLSPMPPPLMKLKKEWESKPTLGLFDAAEVKRRIREGMSTQGDRVKALLAKPEAVKKLDEALEAIGC